MAYESRKYSDFRQFIIKYVPEPRKMIWNIEKKSKKSLFSLAITKLV